VSKNYYDLGKLIPNEMAVKYRQPARFTNNEDRAFTFWFQPQFTIDKAFSDIMNIADSQGNAVITMPKDMKWQVGDLVEITGTSGIYDGYFRIIEIPTNVTDAYKQYVIDAQFVTGSDTGKIRSVQKTFLIHGYGGLFSGLSIEVTKKFIIVSINNVDYFYAHGATLSNDKWYPLVFNLSNTFRTISVYLYELDKPLNFTNPQLESSALKLLYYDLISLAESISVDSGDYWALLAGPVNLTNIRIFKRIIEEEAHNIVLNQYVVNDTQYAELVDNAIPELHLLRLPNPR
jgi:hypothetical protein